MSKLNPLIPYYRHIYLDGMDRLDTIKKSIGSLQQQEQIVQSHIHEAEEFFTDQELALPERTKRPRKTKKDLMEELGTDGSAAC